MVPQRSFHPLVAPLGILTRTGPRSFLFLGGFLDKFCNESDLSVFLWHQCFSMLLASLLGGLQHEFASIFWQF